MFEIKYNELSRLGKELENFFSDDASFPFSGSRIKSTHSKYDGITSFLATGEWETRLYSENNHVKVAVRLAGENKESISAEVVVLQGSHRRIDLTGDRDPELAFMNSKLPSSVPNPKNKCIIHFDSNKYTLTSIKYVSGYLVCVLEKNTQDMKEVQRTSFPVL